MRSIKILMLSSALLLSFTVFSQDTTKKGVLTNAISTGAFLESEASFPGGNEAWANYIRKSIRANVPTKDAPVGKYTVNVKFIVDKNGIVSKAVAETNFGYGMEEEAIRIVEQSPKWTAAIQNSKTVNAFRRQPFTFLVQSPDFTILSSESYTLFTNADNEITINSSRVNAADININVPGGKVIQKALGKFIVRVNKPGRVIIEIINSKKDDKLIGEASFEVKVK